MLTDDDKSNTNRRAEEDYSAHGGPRVAESKSPSHSGTSGNESKEKPLTTGLHHDITSDGIRWNVAHGTGTEIEDKRRTRLKRKRKSGSEQTGEEQKSDTADPDDLNESLSPMTVVAICAGVLVLLCIIVASVWYVVVVFFFNKCCVASECMHSVLYCSVFKSSKTMVIMKRFNPTLERFR